MPARYPDRDPSAAPILGVGPAHALFRAPRETSGSCVSAGPSYGFTARRRAGAGTPAAGLAAQRAGPLPGRGPAGLPRGRHARRRQDDLRAAGGRRAAAPTGCRRGHRGHAHRAPQAPVGAGRGARSASRIDPDFRNADRAAPPRTSPASRSPTPRRGAPAAAPGPHREPAHAGHPRRGAPRRATPAVLGRRGPGGVRAGRPPADADRHAVPQRRQPDPVRRLRARRRRCAAQPGRPLLRLRRGAGRRRGPAGGLPGLLRRGPAGGPAPARRSPPGWASR